MIHSIIKIATNILIGLLTIIGVNYILDLDFNNFWMNFVYAFIGIVLWNSVIKTKHNDEY